MGRTKAEIVRLESIEKLEVGQVKGQESNVRSEKSGRDIDAPVANECRLETKIMQM